MVRTSTRTGHELLSRQKPTSGRPLHSICNFPLVRIDAGYMQCCRFRIFLPDPGSELFPSFPDPNFSHPGSLIRIFSIPDPGSASKNWFMYKLYRHKLYRHNLYRHKLYRHKLYREQIVSGTYCIGNILYREQIVSGTNCIGNKLYRLPFIFLPFHFIPNAQDS
jgi:hypothetical protein